MDIKDSYLHGTVGVVKSISVDADKLKYKLADTGGDDHSGTVIEVTLPSMVAATSDTDGKSGLVPTPSANSLDKYLKGDGTWSDVDAAKLGGINPNGFMRVKASYVNNTHQSANDMTNSGSYRLENKNEGLPLESNYGNVLVVRGLTGASYGDTLAQMFFPYFKNAAYLRTGATGTGTYGFTNREWSRFVLGDDKIKTTSDTDKGVKVELSGTFDEPKIDVTTTFGNVVISNSSKAVSGETIAKSVPLLNGGNGTLIPSNSDLNSLVFCDNVGTYYSSSDANTKTLTNCPTPYSFVMHVYAPLGWISLSKTWSYRIRKITNIKGHEWIQEISSDGNTIDYRPWCRILRADTTFSKATQSTVNGTQVVNAGTGGAVPAPQTLEDNSKFLKGDGTWSIPSISGKVSNDLILKINSGTTEGTSQYTYNGSAAKTLDIKAGSNITLTTAANALTIAASDTKVTQTNTTTSAAYRVLLSGNDNDTTETTTVRKSANLKFNPNTGILAATTFRGKLIGVADSSLYLDPIKVDLVDANNLEVSNQKVSFVSHISSNSSNLPEFSSWANGLLNIGLHSSEKISALLYFSANKPLYYRPNTDSDWKQIAYTDSDITGNAATSDKLKNKVKLWGLDFDGSADVSGDMTGVGNITISATNNKDYFINFLYNSTPTYSWRLGYLGSGSGNANYFVIDSSKSSGENWHRALQIGNETLDATFAGTVTSPTFIGNLDGTYVNKLTGYTKATSASDLAATDSLNTALGKLEYKADTAYDLVKGAYDDDGTIENLAEILKVLEGIKDTETIQAIIGKYLPLTGGTLTGKLTIEESNFGSLIIYRKDSANSASIQFKNGSNVSLGYLGMNTANGNLFRFSADTSTSYKIWDSGNDGSGSGLNADLLDGTHKADLLASATSTNTTNLSITVGGTTKNITNLYARQLGLSSNTITSTTDDTTAKWGSLGTSVHYYYTKDKLTDLPNPWGLVLNVTNGISEVHQLWMTQSSGNLYHRGGNDSGWSGTWRTILDSVNTHIKSGVITINGTTITPLTQHQSLANYVTLDTSQNITGAKTFKRDTTAFTIQSSTGNSTIAFVNSGITTHFGFNKNRKLFYTDDTWKVEYPILSSENYTSYTPILNSSSTHATNTSVIYAPNTAGTKDLILVSNGSGAPVWSDYNSLLPVKLINDPGRTVLIKSYGLNADFGTEDYGAPYEEYLQAFSKYLLDKAAGYTCIGYIRPSSRSSYICDVYDSGINDTTGLPLHITGHCFQFGGAHYHFGTSYGAWYYYTALHLANYTKYTVTKTGGGASGTWGIDITGNAATATTAGKVTCTEASSNNDRPIVGTNMDNLLYYTTKATVNWSTGHIKAGNADVNGVLNVTGSNKFSEGIRLHHYNGLSSLWFGAVNSSGYDAGMWGITVDSSGMRFRGTSSTTGTSASDYINIIHEGNVGIGTSTPTQKLSVEGTILASLFMVERTATSDIPALLVDAKNNPDVTILRISTGKQSTLGDYGFSLKYLGTGGGNANLLNLYADSQTAAELVIAISIDLTGDVGIGLNASSSYKLAVNGSIYSSTGFVKNKSSNSYVLLGGGGHKTISSLSVASANSLNSTKVIEGTEFKLSNASWTDTGYTFASLTTGTYAVQVASGSNLVASGIMSVYTNLSDTAGDEIPLHVYGTAGWRPYLRTHDNKLLISSNDISVTSRTVTIKIALIL